jgi:hypothetical protein
VTGDVVIVTPVADAARADTLRKHLRGLDEAGGPLGHLDQDTHFARFVVLALEDGPRLFFSARFDGDRDAYLTALAARPEAQAIWAHCDSSVAADADALRAYLEAHSLTAPYILSVWPQETVAAVNRAFDRQAQLRGFAARAAGLDPVGLAHAFRQEFR